MTMISFSRGHSSIRYGGDFQCTGRTFGPGAGLTFTNEKEAGRGAAEAPQAWLGSDRVLARGAGGGNAKTARRKSPVCSRKAQLVPHPAGSLGRGTPGAHGLSINSAAYLKVQGLETVTNYPLTEGSPEEWVPRLQGRHIYFPNIF